MNAKAEIPMRQISVRLPVAVITALRVEAARSDRTLPDVLNEAVREWMHNHDVRVENAPPVRAAK